MKRLEACLLLEALPGMGWHRAQKIVAHFGSPEAVFESNRQHLTVHGEKVILRIAFVVPVVVTVAPFELLCRVRLSRGSDVVIDVSNVLDVRGKTDQLPLSITVQTPLHDVAVVLVHHHGLGLKAVLDGTFDHHEIGTRAQRISWVNTTPIVDFGCGIKVAGRFICTARRRATIGQRPIKPAVPRQVGEADPIRHASFQ